MFDDECFDEFYAKLNDFVNSAYNSKAMKTIFNVVSMEEFKRILNVEIAHTAWNILQIRLIWLCFNGSKNKHDPLKNKVGIHE